MAKTITSDELWEAIEPRLPDEPPKGIRLRIYDHAALTSILFVLKKRIPWEMVP